MVLGFLVKLNKGENSNTLRLAVNRGDEITIEYSKREIIDKLNSYFGYKAINNVKIEKIEKISHLCEFTKAKANNLPYPDSMFDFIISTDIFDPEEVKRVLRPGGKFLTLVLIDEKDISPSSLAVSWSLKIESEINVTDLALAFHRAKESEAKLLYQANLIDGREMIEIINAGIKPYTKGGQHYMLKLSS